MDIAQFVIGLDEMIARIEIAVVLQRGTVAARGRMNAEKVTTEIGFECHVEELDKNPPDVAPNPFLENIDEETAVWLAADRALGD